MDTLTEKRALMPDDITRIHTRIDTLSEHVQEANSDMSEKIGNLHGDVKALLQTCVSRGVTCKNTLIQLDKTVRGNGGSGLTTRISNLEKSDSSKEKWVFLVLGCVLTALITAVGAILYHFFVR